VNDSTYLSASSRLEQRPGVGDGIVEGRPASLEPDPIRVVEGVDSFETAQQLE
jgi:hypothetical protein